MNLPENFSLPFFAYGILKPGNLGYPNIQEFVKSYRDKCEVNAKLLIRDGFPIIKEDKDNKTLGCLIVFIEGECEKGYRAIMDMEPDKQYKWEEVNVRIDSQNVKANVLLGKYPDKGSVPSSSNFWDYREDPFFKDAFIVIESILEENKEFEFDFKRYFRVQMAYMLLWVIIERYVSMRFFIGGGDDDSIMKKIKRLSSDEVFIQGLNTLTKEKRTLYRSNNPNKKVKWKTENPKNVIDYYYQIRSNIVHRGKAAYDDFKLLYQCTSELVSIMKLVINNYERS